MKRRVRWLLLPVLLCACGPSDQPVTVRFEAIVGGKPFAIDQAFDGLGTKSTSATFSELKFYVHDVAFVDARGTRTPVKLTDDDQAQRDGLALVDLGTAKASLVGTLPQGFTPVDLEFTLGVPEAKNHLDGTLEKAPLNAPGMFWSWAGGFKFLRLDAKVPNIYYLHLGAMGCSGEPSKGFTCTAQNRPRIVLRQFKSTSTVRFDVAQLYAASDLTAKPDMVTDFVPGCMSDPADPDCTPVLGQLGLGSAPQAVFSLATGPVE